MLELAEKIVLSKLVKDPRLIHFVSSKISSSSVFQMRGGEGRGGEERGGVRRGEGRGGTKKDT